MMMLAELPAVSAPDDLQTEVPAVLTWAKSLQVTTPEAFAEAGDRLKGIKGLGKRIADWFRPLKQSADAAKRAILERERELLNPLDEAERLAKNAMLGYQQREQAKAEAERMRLQALADEAARKERERLEREAAAAKKPETAQRKLEQAAAVAPAPVIHVAPATPKVDGLKTITRWRYRIVNAALIPREFLTPDEKKIDGYGKAMKQSASIPGVEFFTEDTLASGAR